MISHVKSVNETGPQTHEGCRPRTPEVYVPWWVCGSVAARSAVERSTRYGWKRGEHVPFESTTTEEVRDD